MLNQLKQMGLTSHEARVYLACVQHNPTTPTELVSLTGYQRSTLYNYVASLQEKGLVVNRVHGRRKYIAAQPVDDAWHALLDLERKAIEYRTGIVASVCRELKQVSITPSPGQGTILLRGKTGIRLVINLMIKEKQDNYWIGSLDTLFRVFSADELYRRLTLQRMKQSTSAYAITDRSIISEQRFSETLGAFRKHRYLDTPLNASAGLQLFGPYVTLGTYGQSADSVEITLINNPLLAEFMRQVFLALWNRLPERQS